MKSLEGLHEFADIGLTFLRFVIGVIFLVHGWPKVTSSREMTTAMGKPQMTAFFTFIGISEVFGGLGMITGTHTQLAAVGLAIIMVGAIALKNTMMKTPFSAHDKIGWEFDLILLAGCGVLFFTGAGAFSLDRIVFGI